MRNVFDNLFTWLRKDSKNVQQCKRKQNRSFKSCVTVTDGIIMYTEKN